MVATLTSAPESTPLLLDAQRLFCERDGRVLFTDLDIQLLPGDLVELRGPNGSGKTTLLRALAGLNPDFEGGLTLSERLLYQGHRVGLNLLLTPLENLNWYQTLQHLPSDRITLEAALAAVGLAGYDDTPCHRLSAGQQRRVLLARLHLHLAPGGALLWLLDEPLTALDTAGAEVLRGLLVARIDSGGAVLCATHQGLGLTQSRLLDLGAVRL